MRTEEEIRVKIRQLRPYSIMVTPDTADPAAYEKANRIRHQIYALEWALGDHSDGQLNWVSAGLAKLGPEARELFPGLAAHE